MNKQQELRLAKINQKGAEAGYYNLNEVLFIQKRIKDGKKKYITQDGWVIPRDHFEWFT